MAYTKGVALLYLPLFLSVGWLNGNSVKGHGGDLNERRLTRASTVFVYVYITCLVADDCRADDLPGSKEGADMLDRVMAHA